MKSSEFVGKFKSKYLWGNLAAMALVVILLCMGLKYGLKLYTHHGESIAIPDIRNKQLNDAERILDNLGLQVVVTDTGYVKTLPPKTVLAQTPGAGEHVENRNIFRAKEIGYMEFLFMGRMWLRAIEYRLKICWLFLPAMANEIRLRMWIMWDLHTLISKKIMAM